MPRTTTSESASLQPFRALTFDSLGLIKVTEGSGKQGELPKVVKRWGEPDTERCVLTGSINDSDHDPLLAVARKNGLIEVLSPVNGDIHVSIPNASQSQANYNAIVGLHLFKQQREELSSGRSCTLLTCTKKGHVSVRSVEFPSSLGESTFNNTPTSWNVCTAGNYIFCSKVHRAENYAVFGGQKVNVWDLERCTKIWNAESPAKNLGTSIPIYFTSATFLYNDDHRKFVACTNTHQVHLYDLFAQKRRPVLSFEFGETPIKAVAEDQDGNTIYVGNGSGDLASYDIRKGEQLGCFLGELCGSIRSVVRHPNLPVIASCGLDCYLRIWNIKSRQLLSKVFLEEPLTDVVFDSHFQYEEVGHTSTPVQPSKPLQEHTETGTVEEECQLKV